MRLDPLLRSVLVLIPFQLAAPAQVCVPELQELRAGDADDGDEFGSSVALDGDTVVIGAPYEEDLGSGAGAAYVFVHDGTSWVQQAKLLAADGANFHRFGTSVAIDGETLIVGAPGHSVGLGRAYVFVRQAGVWSQQADFPGSLAARSFGHAVALSGDTAAIGAPALDSGTVGAVHIYVRHGSAWSLRAELLDPTTGGLWAREFGKAVSLWNDVLAVGVPSAHLTGNFSCGVAVYRRSAGSWAQEALLIPQQAGYKDYFGSGVAIEGNRLVGGAPSQFYSGDPAVYVFELEGGSWVQKAQLRASGWAVGDQFGASVALSGDAIVAGAWRASPVGPFSGYACAFHRVGSQWLEYERLRPPDGGLSGENHGSAVAIQGARALVGRPGANTLGWARGSAHIYRVPTLAGSAGCFCATGSCANPDAGAGCANSTGAGASLLAFGETNPDELNFLVRGGIPKQFCVFFQADAAVAPYPFGDGMSCAAGGLVALNPLPRMLGQDGALVFGSCAGDPAISHLGGVVPGSGVTRSYQLMYRDPTGSPCGSRFNLTNAVEIVW